jgi:hypothetical protein
MFGVHMDMETFVLYLQKLQATKCTSHREKLPIVCNSSATCFGCLGRLHWTTNFKKSFVSLMNMLLIYLFASTKLEKGHKKIYLALV